MPRTDDLPGSEAPQRYFSYLKTKDFSLLEDVLRHNEQDIASLCVLLNRIAWLYEHPEAIDFGEDVYAMGVALERMDHPEEARRCYRLVQRGRLRGQSQMRLAGSYRKSGNRQEAVLIWQEMIRRREGGVVPYIELAKQAEHVTKDIPLAISYTRQALALCSEPSIIIDPKQTQIKEALQHRYRRLCEKNTGRKD